MSDEIRYADWGYPIPNYCPFCGEPNPERGGSGYWCSTFKEEWWLD